VPLLPSQQEIIRQALAARDRLTREYHLKLNRVKLAGDAPQESSTIEVWSKDSFVRTDVTVHESKFDPAHVGLRQIICRNCERKGYGILTRTGAKDHASAVAFYPLDHAAFNATDGFRLDWMRLGQLPDILSRYAQEPADSFLRFLLDKPGTVTEVEHEGQSCYEVRISFDGGGNRRHLFCPAFGMNPVLVVSDSPRGKFRSETVVTYAKYTGADVWFPKTVTHTMAQEGQAARRERIVIERAELNTAPPARVFTLAGLGLDPGQPVMFPELKNTSESPTWTANGLDWKNNLGKYSAQAYAQKMQQAAESTPPVPDKAPPSNRWLYYAGAGLLAVLAAGVAVILVRRRSAQLGT
jgi:hypothetical protein